MVALFFQQSMSRLFAGVVLVLCHHCRPEVSDSVFTWDDFAMKNNNELLKNVGNLVQRSLSFIFASFGGVVPSQAGAATERDAAFVRSVNALVKVSCGGAFQHVCVLLIARSFLVGSSGGGSGCHPCTIAV